ncbi:MAG TPA: AI-2E family transporter, partial [Actinotalea sp.]|nr:AI-2E family transporter [Actinotalea sp.]
MSDQTAPHWLQVAAGWSWRIILVVAAVVLVFVATSRVLLVFIAVFLALVFTAVLRPLVGWMSKVMPSPLATALSLLLAVTTIAGLFTYIAISVAGQWASLGEQFSDGLQTIFDWLETSPLHLTITTDDLEA